MTTTTPRQTTDQRRAAHAWKAIEAILRKHPHQIRNGQHGPHPDAKNYGHQVKDLPTRILASGLGQAIAFRWAKGNDDERTKDFPFFPRPTPHDRRLETGGWRLEAG